MQKLNDADYLQWNPTLRSPSAGWPAEIRTFPRVSRTMLQSNDMRRIMTIVCERAHRQGFVVPQEVRDELADAGMPEARWTEVVSMAGYMLAHRDGRFYFSAIGAANRREQRRQRRLNLAVRQLIRGYKSSARQERRRRGRIDFVEPVSVETDDGRTATLLSSDLSVNGIRLIGPACLLGQRIRVTLPATAGARHRRFMVLIMWSSFVGEGLCENGGSFLEIVKDIPLAVMSPFPGGYASAGTLRLDGLAACVAPSSHARAR